MTSTQQQIIVASTQPPIQQTTNTDQNAAVAAVTATATAQQPVTVVASTNESPSKPQATAAVVSSGAGSAGVTLTTCQGPTSFTASNLKKLAGAAGKNRDELFSTYKKLLSTLAAVEAKHPDAFASGECLAACGSFGDTLSSYSSNVEAYVASASTGYDALQEQARKSEERAHECMKHMFDHINVFAGAEDGKRAREKLASDMAVLSTASATTVLEKFCPFFEAASLQVQHIQAQAQIMAREDARKRTADTAAAAAAATRANGAASTGSAVGAAVPRSNSAAMRNPDLTWDALVKSMSKHENWLGDLNAGSAVSQAASNADQANAQQHAYVPVGTTPNCHAVVETQAFGGSLAGKATFQDPGQEDVAGLRNELASLYERLNTIQASHARGLLPAQPIPQAQVTPQVMSNQNGSSGGLYAQGSIVDPVTAQNDRMLAHAAGNASSLDTLNLAYANGLPALHSASVSAAGSGRGMKRKAEDAQSTAPGCEGMGIMAQLAMRHQAHATLNSA